MVRVDEEEAPREMSDAELVSEGAVSVAEAARFLGISRARLYEHMNAGEIRFMKDGRRRLLPKRGLVYFLAERLRGGSRA